MTTEESVYNLIPTEEIAQPGSIRYRSKFADQARQEHKASKAPGKLLGPYGGIKPIDQTQFLKKGEGVPKPAPEAQPRPTKVTRPPVPSHTDQPVTGVSSGKNFIQDNVVQVVTAVPPKPKDVILDGAGIKHDLEGAGLKPKFVQKKDYGKTPDYLLRRKEEEQRHQEEMEAYQQARQQAGACKRLSDQEREQILTGLKTHWDQLHREFQGLSLVVDTVAKRNRKKQLEDQLAQIEADIQRVEKHPIIYIEN